MDDPHRPNLSKAARWLLATLCDPMGWGFTAIARDGAQELLTHRLARRDGEILRPTRKGVLVVARAFGPSPIAEQDELRAIIEDERAALAQGEQP